MQPIRKLAATLESLAGPEHYLFMLSDMKAVLPGLSDTAFRGVVRRAEKQGILKRICRGLYLYPKTDYPRGLILYHAAARLRADCFNYLSLESVLSDAGIISQLLMTWITVMTSGRSNIIDCGTFGKIEFVHTEKKPTDLSSHLAYDPRIHLWRASVALAIKDMKRTRRPTDLIDWEAVHEAV